MATCNCRGGPTCCIRQAPLNQTTGAPWTCPTCGQSHPGWQPTCDHSHAHEYGGYQTTGGPTCVICGRRPPEQPDYTVSASF